MYWHTQLIFLQASNKYSKNTHKISKLQLDEKSTQR